MLFYELGVGFWGTYAIEYSVKMGRGVDVSSVGDRIGYILWCYLHMGLFDWIKWLIPPCFYGYGWIDDGPCWWYWFLHVVVT